MTRANSIKNFIARFPRAAILIGCTIALSATAGSLWVAESGGTLKLDALDGAVVLEIPESPSGTGAVGVDPTNGNVWTWGEQRLRGFDRDGVNFLDIESSSYPLWEHPNDLVVDGNAGNIWVNLGSDLHRLNLSGQVVGSLLGYGTTCNSMTLDRERSRLWLCEYSSVKAYDASFQQAVSIPLLSGDVACRSAWDEFRNELWLAVNDKLRRYDSAGVMTFEMQNPAGLTNTFFLKPDGKGGVWLGSETQFVYIDPTGAVGSWITPFHDFSYLNILDAVVHPVDASIWIGNDVHVRRFSTAGTQLQDRFLEIGAGNVRSLQNMELFVDLTPPTISFALPTSGSFTSNRRPTLRVNYLDPGSGVDTETLVFTLNGASLAVSCTSGATSAECQPTADLSDGLKNAGATVSDEEGNESEQATVSFTVDTVNPQITVTSPADSSTSANANITIVGSINEVATLTINGQSVTVNGSNAFSHPRTLVEGLNTFSLVAIDRAGNQGTLTLRVTLGDLPQPPNLTFVQVFDPGTGTVNVSGAAGSVEPNRLVRLTNTRTGATVVVTANAQGSFSAQITGIPTDEIQVRAENAAGGQSDPRSISVPGQALPPEAASVAPQLSSSGFTSFSDSVSFLFSAANPIQTGATTGALEVERIAVVRGTVTNRAGQPLSGVQITIQDQPELGSTRTRANGQFDIAVNGGGTLAVNYDRAGYFPVQRQIPTAWGSFATLDNVVLVPADSSVTTITLNSANAQIHQGSVVTDERGTRRATLFVPAGTGAAMTLADGTTQTLTAMNVRATEYTVGATGLQAMPGELPPTSAYTYAVELSADEALAAGARQVTFTQPLALYVDNFVQFPVGVGVPLAYYDRNRAAWIPEPDGLVVSITAINGGIADIAVRGTGASASAAELAAIGIDLAERERLATLYPVGASLWRTRIRHFSPFDCNWFITEALDGEDPPRSGSSDDDSRDDKDKKDDPCDGCIVKPQSQALGEVLPIVGTGFAMHYASESAAGRSFSRTVVARLTDDTPTPTLMGMELKVNVAGRVFRQQFSPAPNVVATFVWDGLDAYGREVTGSVDAAVTVTQFYPQVYRFRPERYEFAVAIVASWGLPPPPVVLTPAELTLYRIPISPASRSRVFVRRLSALSPRVTLSRAWSLDIHHLYDPSTGLLHAGTGEVRKTGNVNTALRVWAGTGTAGFADDGLQALLAQLSNPSAVAVAANGDLYVVDRGNFRIRRISRATQRITTVAGTGVAGSAGDLGQAFNAQINRVDDIAISPDGSLYLAESLGHRIRRIDRSGVISTIAGTGTAGFNGDGQQATGARLNRPSGVAVAGDGTVYVADSANHRIRRIAGDGTVSTVAGTGVPGFSGDGAYAPQAQLNLPAGLTIGVDGVLYVADTGNRRVRRIGFDGTITTIAGTGMQGYSGDGAQATAAALNGPEGIEVDRFNTLYISDGGRIRVVRDGIITTLAGDGSATIRDGYPATASGVPLSGRVAISADRSVYLASASTNRVYRLEPLFSPTTSPATTTIPSSDGREIFEFDASGRQLRTLDAFTGATRLAFTYSAGLLTQVTDGSGNVTTLERDASGRPTGIVGPFGQRTTISLDSNGYINGVTLPGNEQHGFTYTPSELMTRYVDPRGGISEYQYDSGGLLTREINPGGGGWSLTPTLSPDATDVEARTAEGRATTFRTVRRNATRTQTTFFPDGTDRETRYESNGEIAVTNRDGTLERMTRIPDPRFGMRAPLDAQRRIDTPSGTVYSVSTNKLVQLGNASHPLNLTSHTELVSPNGRTWRSAYDANAQTSTVTSPENRIGVVTEDALRRPLTVAAPGIAPVTYSYDTQGRVTGIAQGSGAETRTTAFSYYASGTQRGLLQSVTNSLNQQLSYQYDPNGRITRVTFPDARFVEYSYDASGNLIGVTPPGRPQHAFSYSANDLSSGYTPPAAGGGPVVSNYEYSLDNQITRAQRPDGSALVFEYLANGNLESVTTPQGSYQYGYNPGTGNVSSVIAPDSQTLTYAFDGGLLAGQTWSGVISGSVALAYNSDFGVTSVAVNGDAATYEFDRDRLVTRAGALEITRDAATGFVTGTALDRVRTTETLSTFGELASFTGGSIEPGGIEAIVDQMNDLLDALEDTYVIVELRRADIDDFRALVAQLPAPNVIAALRQDLLALRVEAVEAEDFGEDAVEIIDDLLSLLDQVEQAQSTFNSQYAFNITRDTLGRITQKIETILGTTATEAYGYDAAGRLSQVTRNGSVIASYSYDSNSNRLSIGGQAASYDNQDRLLSVDGTTYTYTANGDLLTRTAAGQTTTYSYDVLGNLLSAQRPDGRTISYVIDGQNRRVGRRVNGVLTQGFLYQTQLQVAAELDGSGNVVSRFVYGTQPNVPEYMIRGGETYRIIADHLGSPRLVVNAATGAVMQRVDYDTLGNVTSDTNPGFQPFGFAGGLHDRDTGLVRFGARDYDPQVGRWTAKDPINFAGGDTSLYGYALSDPINAIDSSGLLCLPASYRGAVIGGIAGLLGGVVTGALTFNPAAIFAGAAVGAVSGAIAGQFGIDGGLAGAGLGVGAGVGEAVFIGGGRAAVVGGAVGGGIGGSIGGAIGGAVGGAIDGGRHLGKATLGVVKGGFPGLVGGVVSEIAEALLERSIGECPETECGK